MLHACHTAAYTTIRTLLLPQLPGLPRVVGATVRNDQQFSAFFSRSGAKAVKNRSPHALQW